MRVKWWIEVKRKSKDRPTRTPNVVIVVASHYQSLQIIVLLSQARLLEITTFVRYDWRSFVSFENCFQQRLIFYESPVFHHDLFKFLYRRVVCYVFAVLRAHCLKSKVTSDKELSTYFFGPCI